MPNWHNVEDYRFTNQLQREQWPWEFLRRNNSYRRDWEEFWRIWQELEALYGKPPNRDFSRWKQDARAYHCQNKEDRKGSVAHCADDDDKILIECWMGYKWGFYKFPLNPAHDHPKIGEDLCWREIKSSPRLLTTQELDYCSAQNGEVIFGFNLSYSLKEQLEEAKRQLFALRTKLKQQNQGIHTIANQREKWTRYLRILDAMAVNTPEQEIALVLFGDKGDYLEALKSAHKCALELVEGGYRKLLLLEEY